MLMGDITQSVHLNDNRTTEASVLIELKSERSVLEYAFLITGLSAIMLASLIGNVFVIVAIRTTKKLREEPANLLIVNLSITDLCNSALVMFPALISVITEDWQFGHLWCDVTCAANYCLIIVSMLTLAFISIDRYQSILTPLKYHTSTSAKTKLWCMIAYSWIQGVAFALPPSSLGWVHYDYWEAICAIDWYMEETKALIYVTIANVVCFIIPGIIVTFCYVRIARHATSKTNTLYFNGTGPPGPHKSQRDERQRILRDRVNRSIIRSLVTIVIVFFVCMTPFCITKLMKVASPENKGGIPGPANTFASLMQYLASATNPFIYGIFRKQFRKAFRMQCDTILYRVFRVKCLSSAHDTVMSDNSIRMNSSSLTEVTSPQVTEVYTSVSGQTGHADVKVSPQPYRRPPIEESMV